MAMFNLLTLTAMTSQQSRQLFLETPITMAGDFAASRVQLGND
jgi:hypothetical protein